MANFPTDKTILSFVVGIFFVVTQFFASQVVTSYDFLKISLFGQEVRVREDVFKSSSRAFKFIEEKLVSCHASAWITKSSHSMKFYCMRILLLR
jgi:hypothetical protein